MPGSKMSDRESVQFFNKYLDFLPQNLNTPSNHKKLIIASAISPQTHLRLPGLTPDMYGYTMMHIFKTFKKSAAELVSQDNFNLMILLPSENLDDLLDCVYKIVRCNSASLTQENFEYLQMRCSTADGIAIMAICNDIMHNLHCTNPELLTIAVMRDLLRLTQNPDAIKAISNVMIPFYNITGVNSNEILTEKVLADILGHAKTADLKEMYSYARTVIQAVLDKQAPRDSTIINAITASWDTTSNESAAAKLDYINLAAFMSFMDAPIYPVVSGAEPENIVKNLTRKRSHST